MAALGATGNPCAFQRHPCNLLGSGSIAAATCQQRQRWSWGAGPLHSSRCKRFRQQAEPQDRDYVQPPMPPPPAPPGPQQTGFGYQQQQQQQQYASATPKFQELGWREIKERYLRPTYLPLSFTMGALTIGLRLGAANYTFADSPLEYLGTAVSTGLMFMALAWVLFDVTDEPPSGGNFSSPRK